MNNSENNKSKFWIYFFSGIFISFALMGSEFLFNWLSNNDGVNDNTNEQLESSGYSKALSCAKMVARKYNINYCTSFKEIGEDFYNYTCGKTTIRVINNSYDVYSNGNWTDIRGRCS